MDGLLIAIVIAWLVSPIILLILLIVQRNARSPRNNLQAEITTPKPAATPTPDVAQTSSGLGQLSVRDVTSLKLLELELKRLHGAGTIDDDAYQTLTTSFDEVWAQHLGHAGFQPDTGKWHSRRDEAWNVFVRELPQPPGLAPWRRPLMVDESQPAPTTEPAPAPVPQSAAAARQAMPLERVPLETAVTDRGVSAENATSDGAAHQVDAGAAFRQANDGSGEASIAAPTSKPPSGPFSHHQQADEAAQASTSTFAFETAEPSAFSKAVERVSGWPKLAAPFLVQNVGWFVGGFCFVAGTLFLVSVTTGYANALVILASLAMYTGFLLWAGYIIRRKNPDLRTSSNVLLTICMLLAPLNITAGVHLISAGLGSTPALLLAIALAGLQCVGVLLAARFVNALMDRSLPLRHAQLFTALSALQYAAPAVATSGNWMLIAVAHATALGLLGWGLIGFARDWVRSIFLDRRLIAYYAAGLLVFAAVVSFVQIAYADPAPLPKGYFGPYLMALCAMLFYVDAALKEWTKKFPFLSRFSFVLYALTVVALLLCFDAPGPRSVTLVLAIATYAQVLWRFSSVPALYLLLAAIGWLFASTVLVRLASEYHMLASLPVLAGLFAMLRWAQKRSAALATVCLRVFGLTSIGLTAWSLVHSSPGPVAFATGVIATLAIFFALSSAPWLLRVSLDTDQRSASINPAPWYYVVGLLATVSIAYAPPLSWLTWPQQFAFSMLALAAVATWIAFYLRSNASRARSGASLNCAVLLIGASLVLGAGGATAQFSLTTGFAVLAGLAGCLMLWLSVELQARWMFYGVLAAFGLAALIAKRTFFPGLSFGTGALLGSLLLWSIIWWLGRHRHLVEALGLEPIVETSPRANASSDDAATQEPVADTPMRVLWCMPIARVQAFANGVEHR